MSDKVKITDEQSKAFIKHMAQEFKTFLDSGKPSHDSIAALGTVLTQCFARVFMEAAAYASNNYHEDGQRSVFMVKVEQSCEFVVNKKLSSMGLPTKIAFVTTASQEDDIQVPNGTIN